MRKGSTKEVAGVKKMGEGWLVLPEDATMRDYLCQRKVFDISNADISSVCTAPPEFTQTKPVSRKSKG
jgi:hypothetical protein